jgi:flagella basal body P-ring formation protein FlgA
MIHLLLAVVLASGPQRVSGARIAALAEPVAHAVPIAGDAALIPLVHVPSQLVPSGMVTLQAGSALVTSSFVNVPVRICVNGTFVRNVFVGYRVQRYVRTAVATHDLVPGAVLTGADVEMRLLPYTGQPVNGTSALIGRKIVAAIRAGAPIYIESTQTNQIVHAGDFVVLVVDAGGVSVVADVVARTSGGLGDEVAVYNPQTNKLLSGTVVGSDRVELNLGDVR